MARKGGGSTQRLAPPPHTNGNGIPPPSTIAAQIVHNAANANAHQEATSKVTFAQLLKEFLHNPSTDEKDVQLMSLISVIAEAGLDALSQEDPFALDQQKEQGIDSISALKLIFQRKAYLMLNLRDAGDDGSPHPPLFAWLFPKLLGLLNQPDLLSIYESVQDLLGACLSVMFRTSDLWRQAMSLMQLYKACVEDIMTSLEPDEEAPRIPRPFVVILPASSSISDFWPDSQQSVALPQDLQRTFHSPIQAISTALHLLRAILNSLSSADRGAIAISLYDHHLPWILDSCRRLWNNYRQWSNTQRTALYGSIEDTYLQVLETTAFPDTATSTTFMSSSKAALTLVSSLSELMQTCSTSPFSQIGQIRLACVLIRLRQFLDEPSDKNHHSGSRRSQNLKPLISDVLGPSIERICENPAGIGSMHKDLQLAICLWTQPSDWPREIADLRDELCSDAPRLFSDDQLQQQSILLVRNFRDMNYVSEKRPPKRRKTLPKTNQDSSRVTYDQLIMLINNSTEETPGLGLSNLHRTIPEKYSNISETFEESEKEQCELLSAFAKLACAGTGCLNTVSGNDGHWMSLSCKLCDFSHPHERNQTVYWNNGDYGEDWKDAIATMLNITQEENFLDSSKPRVYMALAIRRVFNHISDADYLNLNMCSLGQWLLGSLNRSLRELKIAAVQALMVFLRDDVPKSIRGKNRMSTLEFLFTLTKRDVLSEQETLIMAYGQAARVCGEDELPIILLQLVEYLGHTNALICGMAYSELASIADAFKTTPVDLLRPFWRSIGFAVMKDLHKNPQKAQHLSDLTEQSVNQLLLSTHTDTLPHLVLTKRKDILERIAKARGTSIEDICTQPRRNLAGILALLLCQPVTDVEQNAMETLVTVAPAFQENGNRLDSLVKLEPVMVACEVLKLAADQNESHKAHFHRGFRTLTMLAEMKDGQRRSSSKNKTLQSFFEIHILGIMAHFSEVLDSPLAVHPLSERKRCVGAIGEMIILANNYVSFALPQVRACLQSAMADTHLCDQTFLVWSSLLKVLDEEDLELVVDQTFALIVQNWSCFSDETQLKVNETLVSLVKAHDSLLRERIDFIPSLATIPIMSKLEGELTRLKAKVDRVTFFNTFAQRCNDENAVVARQALKELVPFLDMNQKILHESAISQKPMPALAALSRSLLDACVRFGEDHDDIPILCAQSLGLIGGLDPYRVESVREKEHILVLSNFRSRPEVIDFAAFLLERILVKVFLSTTNARAQGFLAYVMQELLRACGFNTVAVQRPRASSQPSPAVSRWLAIPDAIKGTLTPFLNSRYVVHLRGNANEGPLEYPIFRQDISHATWLRTFVYDLLQKGKEENTRMIFPVLARIIKGHDLSIATFILPFAVLNVVIKGTEQEIMDVGQELLIILETKLHAVDQSEAAGIKECSENIFQTLDYLTLWLQEKRKAVSEARVMAGKTGRGVPEDEEMENIQHISSVERVLQLIPAEVISKRAVECGSFARALFHWEQYYRQEELKAQAIQGPFEKDELLQHLQSIYAQIDEPDSIEGISAHLQVLNSEQQIMEHRKAGRWTAAQSWYELALAEKPNDPETQINLLTCLKESGQYDSILNYVDGFHVSSSFSPNTLPFAAEAAWSTGKWDQLERILASPSDQQFNTSSDFNVGVGKALLSLRDNQGDDFMVMIRSLREAVAKSLSPSSSASLHACHDYLVKLHALYELEVLSGVKNEAPNREVILENLDRRLDLLGAYTSDKQYILGLRRAAMQLSKIQFTKLDIASAWLTTARLARKGDFTSTAFNSVLHAAQLGDDASKIEYSKLLWKEGHHRKAIQHLQGALLHNVFQTREGPAIEISVNITMDQLHTPNKVKCQAQLLLSKWLDQSGQTKALTLKDAYAAGIMSYPKWDKGHYYLGRYYLKLLESERKLPPAKQSNAYLAGETAKLVIENFIRSTVYGTKHYYQTIPKVLTLWLGMGMEVLNSHPRTPRDKENYDHKVVFLDTINKYIKRYTTERVPAFAWYTAFPQLITRISHPNKNVWDVLQTIIIRVASHYPQQALWSLMAVIRATQDDRRARGTAVLYKLRGETSKRRNGLELKNLILHGQRLTDALLSACDAPVEQRASHVSLSKDLGFNLKLAPCALVVPIEATMVPNLPAGNDSRVIRNHSPFPQDAITIASFADEVLVLSSLQRPRKVNVRGSDGRSYGLLCKPKDDLRKDQRLMEFNAMINRALQRDIESSRRRLYIKTYGVTPLNEECGTIEWVEGLKPMRDIIIRLYRQKGIPIDYSELRMLLNEACTDASKVSIFTHRILAKFQPVLYEWFVESFPEPEAWFAARLRYTRSCAVMSIIGHVLGLGDRHGENVLLEEGNGGTFHVDFNCLFDKGLTFEKPELVPFRLTHNMVDAMGPQAVEGPFRKAAELTYAQLRQHEDTLITILETFVHDPTADFLGGKRKKKITGVPDTPQEVLESVKGKVAGLMRGEAVPLSVEGYVDALVQIARDPKNLAAMYVGWCAFF
ncbi:protein kinase rad3 [Massariosphaeria phaeospora]|uniref:Serine/threonine-protein kinase MEC1 n=1 Tax=Massariosphaeria phaeospora TaxID=100035 RepID=A0A7C8I3Y5_9PLEO|nr:protein kinase rad3 [Massariosphaeria phaeospora]